MLATKKIYTILKNSQKQGRLKTQRLESDPRLVLVLGYFSDGTLKLRYTIDKKGRLHGPGRMFYDTGQLEREDPFHKGVLHGRQRLYYRSGTLQAEANYTNNRFDGDRREYYPTGRIMMECTYRDNDLEGPLSEWHASGQLKERGSYQNGKRHGIFKEFDESGRLLNKDVYVHGARYTGKIKRLINSKRLRPKRIRSIKSAALRRILLEEIGYERFIKEPDAVLMDRCDEEELYRVDWHKSEEPLFLVKVKCPSTQVFYTLRVPPHVKGVKEAVAWTFGIEKDAYQPEEET